VKKGKTQKNIYSHNQLQKISKEGSNLEFKKKERETSSPPAGGLFKWIESVGNKIPDPFMLFVYLTIFLVLISAFLSSAGVAVVNPITHKTVAIKNLLSKEALQWFLTDLVKNYTNFPVLGMVMVVTLGIGLVEKTGLLTAIVKSFIFKIPKSCVTLALLFIAFFSHIASDVALVIMPPIGAMVFYSLGRHPLAGMATAIAGVGAGFTANFFIVTTDVLLSGISTQAVKVVDPNMVVTPLDNWIFMSVSVLLLCLVATLITEKIVEPRLGPYIQNNEGILKVNIEDITPQEKQALKAAGVATALYAAVLMLLVIPEGALLRNPQTGLIMGSPFLRGIIPVIFFLFVITGTTYGVKVGIIKRTKDISRLMGESIKQLSGFLVLVFAISQFTAALNWANFGVVIATAGADFLQSINVVGVPAILAFMVLASFIALFIASGSAMWAMLAPMFLPMFMMLGYHPAFIQMAFRIAMSVMIPIMPTNPFLPIFLKCMLDYDPEAGMGTYLSLMLPYSIGYIIVWPLLMIAWYWLGLPIGPGVYPRL
jgi:aminobenzoyl-glutamate transport protein